MGGRKMTEQRLVSAAIRIIGLWRIFYAGGNALYFVLAKHLNIATSSLVPVTTDWFSVAYEVVLGGILVLAASFIAQAIFGTKSASQP